MTDDRSPTPNVEKKARDRACPLCRCEEVGDVPDERTVPDLEALCAPCRLVITEAQSYAGQAHPV